MMDIILFSVLEYLVVSDRLTSHIGPQLFASTDYAKLISSSFALTVQNMDRYDYVCIRDLFSFCIVLKITNERKTARRVQLTLLLDSCLYAYALVSINIWNRVRTDITFLIIYIIVILLCAKYDRSFFVCYRWF